MNRLKYIFPQKILLTLYNSLFLSHVNYGLLLWGTQIYKVDTLQKSAIRIVTNSRYIAHSEPLLKSLDLIKFEDIFKLKLLKFFYNLSYNLLPPYFDWYLNVVKKNENNQAPYHLRPNARPLIKPLRIFHVFAESSVLFQLVKLINTVNQTYPEILRKIDKKSHSYYGFGFNIKRKFLGTYYNCNLVICYTCGRT